MRVGPGVQLLQGKSKSVDLILKPNNLGAKRKEKGAEETRGR
jgi:hypothetical protein